MEYMNLIKKRRSIRRYKPTPVSEQALTTVLEAARLAPSWGNLQCWQYIIVTDKLTKEKIAGTNRKWISEAPVIIVACADPEMSGHKPGRDYYMLDIGISFQHLILAAADLGLGTCWIGAFDEKKVREALSVPDHVRVVAYTPLGYPVREKRHVYARKPINEICHYGLYGQRKQNALYSAIDRTIGKMYVNGLKLGEY